jgi:hypothetical protein
MRGRTLCTRIPPFPRDSLRVAARASSWPSRVCTHRPAPTVKLLVSLPSFDKHLVSCSERRCAHTHGLRSQQRQLAAFSHLPERCDGLPTRNRHDGRHAERSASIQWRASDAFRGSLAVVASDRTLRRCADVYGPRAPTSHVSASCARHALAAAQVGVVELFKAPEDRRAWQVALTPTGRRALEQHRVPQFAWIATLLNGLETSKMHSTQHVLRVIRLRLERYARELREANRSFLSEASARR